MKILEEKYPKGTIPGQRSNGRYIDKFLWENLNYLAKNIIKDMTFLVWISSSTLEVGTGKSVFAQQICEAYLEAVKQNHGIDNKLTMKNIVFSPKELIKRAFEVPKYSVIILDEWEDAHYFSELGVSLRQFFRKCRQLNLFMICIVPNFFQLPKNYAISRSVFLIDVKFDNNFKRGYYSFYSFQNKKRLYIDGKKSENYNVVRADFSGRFTDGYVVDEKKYRKAKYMDMINQEKQEKIKANYQQRKALLAPILKNFHSKLPLTINKVKEIPELFGITERIMYSYINNLDENEDILQQAVSEVINPNTIGIKNEVDLEPKEEEEDE